MLGASGAISAVLGAFLALYPHARIKTLALVFVVQVPAWLYLGGWFLYQLREAQSAIVDSSEGGSGIALFAHIGGFVFGWIVGRTLLETERRRTESPARRSALTPL
jgi:rhomboid family protein